MPEFHDVVPLRAPRYVNHFGKLLIVMVLFIATQTIWLVQDIQKYHRARRSGLSTSANVFEVVAKPSGEGSSTFIRDLYPLHPTDMRLYIQVIICTSTPDGARTSSSRPVWVGKFAECILSVSAS